MGAPHDRLGERTIAVATPNGAPVLSMLSSSALVLFLVGVSLVLGVSLALLDNITHYSLENTLPRGGANGLALRCLLGGVIGVALPASYVAWCRTRAAIERVDRLSAVVAPLTLSFAVPLFVELALWRDAPLLFSSAVVLWGLGLERTLGIAIRAWPDTAFMEDFRRLWPRLSRWAPRVGVGVMVTSFFAYMAYHTILRHLRLESRAYDLGVYDNMMFNLLRGEWFASGPVLGMRGSHIQYHATFSAYLLAPIYALWQRPETLLVIQTAVCSAAAFPLYGLARLRLRSAWMAMAVVAAYLGYGPLHGPMFYDFHFLTLAPGLVFTVIYLFETRRTKWLFVALVVALLTREDIAIGLSCVFLFYLVSGERPGAALAGGLLSAAYLLVVKFWVLPAHSSSLGEDFLYVYKELVPKDRAGFSGVLRTMLTNPYYLGERVLTEAKLGYFLQIVGPLLLLPLRRGRALILLLGGTLLVLFSTGYDPVTSTAFQYTNHWIPYVFFAAVVTVGTWLPTPGGRVRMAAAVGAMLAVSVLMSSTFGALRRDNSFRGGFSRVSFEFTQQHRQDLGDLRALIAQIPDDASVTASEVELPQVSSRRYCFTLRNGHNGSDFILIRISEARDSRTSKAMMTTALQSGEYGIVETRGKFQLWQKGYDQTGNEAAARVLRIALSAPPSPQASPHSADSAPPSSPAAVEASPRSPGVPVANPSAVPPRSRPRPAPR